MRVVEFWATLLPFVLSSLVAQGFMPARATNGVIMLVICTGNGMVEMAFDAVTMDPVGESDGDQGKSTSAYCALAASQLTIALPPPVSLAMPTRLVGDAGFSWPDTAPRYVTATGLPPATGPPYLV